MNELHHPPKQDIKKRWYFIPLGIVIFMCLGTVYSWSVFRKPIEAEFDITATESGLPYMLFLAFYAIFMPIAGSFIEKYRPNRIAVFGGLIVAAGWILSGYTTNIRELSITYGIIGGSGVGIVYGVPMAVVARWFPDKKGLAVGLTLGGFGLSPFLTAPLANWLVSQYGPLQTFKILGIAYAFVIVTLAYPLRFPKGELHFPVHIKKKYHRDVEPGEMVKSRTFFGIWTCYVIGTLIGLMIIGITSPIAEEVINLNARTAALMVSFFAIFNGLGRPIFGWLTDRFTPRVSSVISFSMLIIASLMMLRAEKGSLALYALSFTIFWMNLGGWLAIAPAATGIFFGHKNYSKNYGLVFTAYGLGAVLGTILSGKIRDTLGSYVYIFYPTIGLAIMGIIIALFFLKNPHHS